MQNPNFVLKPEWGPLATFVPNKHLPVYNWFYYKEGFSRDLVAKFLTEWEPKTVLDPFCGVGTTLVACREFGIDAFGLDISPVCLLASRVKTRDYDLEELGKAIGMVKKSKFQFPDKAAVSKYIKRFFNAHTLDDVLFFRDFLQSNFSGHVRDFLLLGLVSASIKCSHMQKDGAVLKVKKHHVPPFRKYYVSLLNRMAWDVKLGQAQQPGSANSAEFREKISFKPCRVDVIEQDARELSKKMEPDSIDAVITSPPYLNKIEYSKVYGIEELLFFNRPENTSIRSFIGQDYGVKQAFPDLGLPPEANAYFLDLKKVLAELHKVCRPCAGVAMVVGSSWFGDKDDPKNSVHVECDALLGRLAEETGFRTEKIYIVAERFFTINRVVKIGKARESVVVLKKA